MFLRGSQQVSSVFGRVCVVVQHQRTGVKVRHQLRAAFIEAIEQAQGGLMRLRDQGGAGREGGIQQSGKIHLSDDYPTFHAWIAGLERLSSAVKAPIF